MYLQIAFSLLATGIVPDGSIKLHDVVIATPSGFQLAQDAVDGDVAFAGFTKPDARVLVYVRRGTAFRPRDAFGVGGRVTREVYQRTPNSGSTLAWTMIETEKTTTSAGASRLVGFWTTFRGNTYFGASTAASLEAARANAEAVLAETED